MMMMEACINPSSIVQWNDMLLIPMRGPTYKILAMSPPCCLRVINEAIGPYFYMPSPQSTLAKSGRPHTPLMQPLAPLAIEPFMRGGRAPTSIDPCQAHAPNPCRTCVLTLAISLSSFIYIHFGVALLDFLVEYFSILIVFPPQL